MNVSVFVFQIDVFLNLYFDIFIAFGSVFIYLFHFDADVIL